MDQDTASEGENRFRAHVQAGIVRWIAEREELAVASIDCSRALTDYGLSSMDLLDLQTRLREISNVPMDPELLWETPSIAALIEAVVQANRPEPQAVS